MNTLDAELALFKSYCDALYHRFASLEEKDEERWKLLGRVRMLASQPEPADSGFDFKHASNIREDLNLTRRQLCKQLNVGLHEVTLYKYETGRLTPNPKAPKGASYLKWLKKNGF